VHSATITSIPEEPAVTNRKRLSIWCALFLAIALAAVVSSPAVAQDHHPQPPKTLRLYVFDCGTITGLDPGLFNFKKEELARTDFVVPCYLIVDPKGTLLWDVGAIPDTAFKTDNETVKQSYFTATRTLKSQLAEIGYSPADITYLGLSHYHADHTANANEFAHSTWLVRKEERDVMFGEKPPQIIDPTTYSDLKNSKTIIIKTDEYDVFGDGKVIIKSAPGHTPGHQVLILKLAKTGNVMLAGDLYHYPEERTTGRVPTFESDKEQSVASRAMIEEYCRKTNTQLWIEHDAASNAKLKKSPKFYD
jgi:N-acyl homoserine lactone hydrolase